jgi:hypothetical protein
MVGPIVDIIQTQAAGIAYDTTQKFVVNNAAAPPYVNLGAVVNPPDNKAVLFNASQQFLFQVRDTLRILSYGVSFPYQFSAALNNLNLQFLWFDPLAHVAFPVSELGAASFLAVPFENCEFAIDVLLSWPIGVDPVHRLCLVANIYGGNVQPATVSMVGVPSSLNGQTLAVIPFVKVMHNLAMVN